MAETYIQRAKLKAKWLISSPICGNSQDNPSKDKAIEYVTGMSFYPHQTREIKFWARVLKELQSFK